MDNNIENIHDPMTIEKMVFIQIKFLGGLGLVNPGLECGCGLDDLMPCENPSPDCEIATYKDEEGLFWNKKPYKEVEK